MSILLLTPLLGLVATQLPLQPPALSLGLGVFCAMPTALSSGVTFTQQIGGNVSLALLLTVASNLLGTLTMPFVLPHVLSAAPALTAETGVGLITDILQPVPLLLQLSQLILLPTLLGAAVRGFVPGAAQAIDGRRRVLSYMSAALLALVPWMQVSKAAASQEAGLAACSLLSLAAAGIGIHVVFLLLNATFCKLLRLGGPGIAGRDVQRAILLVCSVKTLPVAVTVCSQLVPAVGDAVVGIAVVACVIAHLGQILFDSLLVSHWLTTAADSLEGGRRTGSSC